ncbi:zinc/iron ABC transporter permease [Fructobacillus pseudoficulneus]|uniref:Zinc/iron ABC transporter permease n=1 Tax=Fructobacillus pseudoficulneus TaxID=220714 RepID=A0A3F3H7B9_9LACO|nr:metal ABC transporter permease [Fructobacillus pseudoficulneus]GAP02383.1 zinc/iron ABC transporter permease [Fructobacillus pseudoficulneus]SEH36602.1 zinc/manganese transport system permease protein [Fructobacillus pseudoficulneus]
MFEETFMQNAFIAGTLISVVAGIVGTFVVARSYNFLSHSLSEIAFAGAAFGFFAGWPPLLGMVIFTILAALAIGGLENAQARQDNVTSAVSALAIGLGVLFLALGHTSNSAATGILFGSVLGISHADILILMGMAVLVLVVIFLFYKPLRLLSFDEAGLLVRNSKKTTLKIIFLIVMALSVSISSQLVGSLLIFVLVTLPAASARYYQGSVSALMALSVFFALFGTWTGLALAYLTNLPTSVFIAVIEVGIYLVSIWLSKD